MTHLRKIATGFASLLFLASANAQGSQSWSEPKCNKDPFTLEVSCSTVVLETLPTTTSRVMPGALFAWVIGKGEKSVILLLSVSTVEEPSLTKNREKAVSPILVRIDGGPIHTIKPADIILSIKQAPPYRQMFEMQDDLVEQMSKGDKIFVRFESSSGGTMTKEFSLKNTANRLYAMMTKYMELRAQDQK
jgi:hypothetical protein